MVMLVRICLLLGAALADDSLLHSMASDPLADPSVDWQKYVPGMAQHFTHSGKKGSEKDTQKKSPSLLLAAQTLSGEQKLDCVPMKLNLPEAFAKEDWNKFVPSFVNGFAKDYVKKSEEESEKRVQKREEKEEEKKGEKKGAAPAVFLAQSDLSTDEAKEEQSLRAVSAAEQAESQARARAQASLEKMKDASWKDIIRKVSDWGTVDELSASSTQKDAHGFWANCWIWWVPGRSVWENALEKRIQMLDKFNKEHRKDVLDFNASRAVELVYAVQTAAAHVELNNRRRGTWRDGRKEESMKSSLKSTRYAAIQHVKSLEADTRDAAHRWKASAAVPRDAAFRCREEDPAQKAAHMSENVYERHEDVMSDAAGDVANRAENKADRLKDQVNDYFSRIEDEVHRSSFDARSRELLRQAKDVVSELHEVAERLGAQAAYQEAESSAKFKEEEKRWESYQSPKMLFEAPNALMVKSSMLFAAAGSFALVFALLRRRQVSRPLDIEAPPLLG
eukprot:g26454.t1